MRLAWSNFLMDDHILHNFSEKGTRITDPKNRPNVLTTTGTQYNSELYVGTGEDYPWISADSQYKVLQGTVSYITYRDIDGKMQAIGIYLPPGYDKHREYPVVFVSHGGGGNESDWFSQGNVHNIMDNLICQGKTKEAILVTMITVSMNGILRRFIRI